jgi:hypothetical protein
MMMIHIRDNMLVIDSGSHSSITLRLRIIKYKSNKKDNHLVHRMRASSIDLVYE